MIFFTIMSPKDSVYSQNWLYAFFNSFFFPILRPAFLKSVPSIFYNFFFCQFRAAFLPGRIPVTKVDHRFGQKSAVCSVMGNNLP